jgi:hypothetical protein
MAARIPVKCTQMVESTSNGRSGVPETLLEGTAGTKGDDDLMAKAVCRPGLKRLGRSTAGVAGLIGGSYKGIRAFFTPSLPPARPFWLPSSICVHFTGILAAIHLLQVRKKALNDELRETFVRWYPGMRADQETNLAKKAA